MESIGKGTTSAADAGQSAAKTKWVCKEYNGPGNGYGNSNQPTGRSKTFDREDEAVEFYQQHKSAQRFAGNAYSPYWSYPVKVEEATS